MAAELNAVVKEGLSANPAADTNRIGLVGK